jgi:HK97 family phage portal protein
MNLWNRAATRMKALLTRREAPRTSPTFYFYRSTAGETVDGETALRQATVWACLSYLSRTVAQLPWKVLRDGDSGSMEARDHPVAKLLKLRPHPEISAFAWKEQMVWWAASYGNAVAELQKDARGSAQLICPVEPWRVSIDRDRATGRLEYLIANDTGAPTVLNSSQVFHLRGYGAGPVGLNVVEYAAESIGWSRATEVFGSSYFGQGMAPSGVLKSKGKLSPDGLKLLKEEVRQTFSGAKNAHRTLVLDVDMDFEKLAVDPSAAQLVETRQHQVEEICRWFGVPPHKVMHLLRSTFSNIEHQSIEVVVDSITPWALRLEQEADYKLFGANRDGYYTKLDLKGLLRGAYKDRQEGLQIMRRNGVINVNEWRALEDMNPIGEAGEKYIVEGNMTTLEKVGETPEPVAAPPPADDDDAADDARPIDDKIIDAAAWRRRQQRKSA